MTVTAVNSRSKSNSTTCQAECPEFHILSSHSILATSQSYPQFTGVANKHGEVRLLPKVINLNGRVETHTKSL